ncbi:MAG TPA: aspartate-semialdehyde dehydrogenase [Polyangia bacterium]|nr:aspartate-semialdehyde dehydrogenase [Polyangia bacterium]
MSRIPVCVVGATGLAGQQFLAALADHPLFQVARLAASERSAGKRYGDAIRDSSGASRWYVSEPLPRAFAELPVEDAAQLDPEGLGAAFCAVESDAAREIEPRLAEKVPVLSTASAFRYDDDVPVFIPGVNMAHAPLIDVQRKRRGWKGFITPGPNCTTTGLAMSLAPLHQAYGVRSVLMTSLQSVSGAGRSPGVMGLDIIDNVVPYIAKEEDKVQRETQKILGRLHGHAIEPAAFPISATCTRVPVLEGHTEAVFVSLARAASIDQVKASLREWGAEFLALGLPSAPRRLIVVHDDPFRPQPRLDRDAEQGMATSVGRLRLDPALEHGLKYVLVSHNTKMGAARGAILVGEYLAKQGYLG